MLLLETHRLKFNSWASSEYIAGSYASHGFYLNEHILCLDSGFGDMYNNFPNDIDVEYYERVDTRYL